MILVRNDEKTEICRLMDEDIKATLFTADITCSKIDLNEGPTNEYTFKSQTFTFEKV